MTMPRNPYWTASDASLTYSLMFPPDDVISWNMSTSAYADYSGAVAGTLSSYDTIDFVAFYATAGSSYTALSSGDYQTTLAVFDSSGYLMNFVDGDDIGFYDTYPQDSVVGFVAEYTGWYYFDVFFQNGNFTGGYALAVVEDLYGDGINNTASGGGGGGGGGGTDGNDNFDMVVSGTYYGGLGNDTVFGSAAADSIYGNVDNDYLWADSGNDIVFGGQGYDTVAGGMGDDVVYGNMAEDEVWGDNGNDTLYGGLGNDTLLGIYGDDRLIGNRGDDVLFGHAGYDTFVFNAVSGHDQIWEYSVAEDMIEIQGGLTYSIESYDTNSSLIRFGTDSYVIVLGIGVDVIGAEILIT